MKFNATKSGSQHLTALRAKIKASLNIDWLQVTWDDMRKPLYSAIAALLFIESAATEPIPVKLEYQAAFWKKYYRANGDTDTFVLTAQTMIEGKQYIIQQ